MENRLMSFGEFNSLYESYGFINEAEDKSIFNPANPTANKKEIAEIFATAGATNEAGEINAYKPILKGEKGARVVEIQKYLGINPADGIFGPNTEAKVKEFQKANKLTIDGKVGVQTLRKMMSLKGNVTDVKKQDQIIVQKFIVKTAAQAKAAGIDPKMLLVFERVVVVKNGEKTFVICYPKKDAAQTVKTLDGKGLLKANWEWMKKAAGAVGKALLYTVTGVLLLGVDAANAIISSVVSAGAWVAKGAMTAVGAVVQGIASVADWAAKGARSAYNKVAAWTNEGWKAFCTSAGKVMKASVQAFTAFMDGLKSVLKGALYTITGVIISAWRGIKSVLSSAVRGIVEAAKDAADFVKRGMSWIGKNVKNGAQAFARTIKAGWDATVNATKTALAAGVSMVKSAGEAVVSAANTAGKYISDGFNYLYNVGKSFWESEEYADFFGEDIVFEDLDWSMDFDLNSDEFGYEIA